MKEIVSHDAQAQASVRTVNWAFEHTPKGSLLRSVLVSFAALRWNRSCFADNAATYYPEFVQNLAKFLMRQTDKDIIWGSKFEDKLPEFLEVPKP